MRVADDYVGKSKGEKAVLPPRRSPALKRQAQLDDPREVPFGSVIR